MSQRFGFYFRYALRSIQRGGRWTVLAVLCITAGVATVVALRSMGLAIGDTLTSNVRIETKGDMLIRSDADGSSDGFEGPADADESSDGFEGPADASPFHPTELRRLQDWAADKDAETTAFMRGGNVQIIKTDGENFGRPSFIGSYFIDPQTYSPIRAIDPPGASLSELLTGANEVVISDNLASQDGIAVGDAVRVSGTEELYTVRGIVSAAEETSASNLLNAFFGFAYFDLANAQSVIDAEFAPNQIGILFPEAVSEEQMQEYIREVSRIVPQASTTSTFDLLRRYGIITQYLGDFIVVMGLGALLIGGVGIMNTMLVLVRRRTEEIAAVKTFGLKASQVASLFFTEALMFGFIGSVLGLVAGLGLSVLVNQYGSVALRQPLVWRVYPEALLFGFTLGMVVTGIFGVAPILTALRVRPSIILRPNENHVAALGILQSLALLVFVTISLGLIVGQIVRPSLDLALAESSASPSPYLLGVLGVAFTFLCFAIVIAILWLIVFIISKLPSFGSVTLRLALRSLSANRLRTATTMLALIAGMLSLSSIAFVGEGTRELLNLQLSRSFGGNILVTPLPLIPRSLVRAQLNRALQDVDVTYSTTILSYEGELPSDKAESEPAFVPVSVSVWDSDNPDIYSAQAPLYAGRLLTLADRGQPRMTLPLESALAAGLDAGDRVAVVFEGDEQIELEVVGITNPTGGLSPYGSAAFVPPDVISASANSTLYTYQVPDEELNRALAQLSTVIAVFSIDVGFVDGLIARLINQFAAIPTVVGLLSLFAAAVIMANTVALSTLERRRQIGILKAIGLKSGRILRMMLIESSLVGLLSAAIGIGLSVLMIALLSAIGGIAIPLPTDARITALGLLVAAVLIGWAATFLSARIAIKERVMNVLRYD